MLRLKTKCCPSSTLNTTGFTGLGLNLVLSGDKPMTTCLSQGVAHLHC
jgi:hypothetical protein